MNQPLIPAPRVSFDLTADVYARLAVERHQRDCHECGNPERDSRCGLGERYLAAANNSNDDIPGYLAD